MSKTTVYNTLNLFARNGLVRTIKAEGDSTLYDSNTENHAHFYNLDSGEITDIDAVRVHDLPSANYRRASDVPGTVFGERSLPSWHYTGDWYGAADGGNDVWQCAQFASE